MRSLRIRSTRRRAGATAPRGAARTRAASDSSGRTVPTPRTPLLPVPLGALRAGVAAGHAPRRAPGLARPLRSRGGEVLAQEVDQSTRLFLRHEMAPVPDRGCAGRRERAAELAHVAAAPRVPLAVDQVHRHAEVRQRRPDLGELRTSGGTQGLRTFAGAAAARRARGTARGTAEPTRRACSRGRRPRAAEGSRASGASRRPAAPAGCRAGRG